MKEADIALTPIPQANGLIKNRPVILLRQMPGFGDFLVCGISTQLHQEVGYSLKAGLSSRWLSGVEAGGVIRFDSAQRTTPKLSQLKREARKLKDFLVPKLWLVMPTLKLCLPG